MSAHTVALLRPPVGSHGTTEMLERLRGELLSVGFEVIFRDRLSESSEAEPEAWQQALALSADVDAVVDVAGGGAPYAVDVWIIDGKRRFHAVARVGLEANTDNSSKRLAIRVSEVLRARLFERPLAAGEPARAVVVPPPSMLDQAEENEHFRHFGLELGAVALKSLGGLGLALIPLGRFDWSIGTEVMLQATLAGGGTRPTIATSAGSARVGTQYGLLGGCYRLNWNRSLRPFGAVSAGALRTEVDGRADSPREGHSAAQWSLLLDASLGAALEVARHYSVTLALHAQLAEPYVAIRFAEQSVASSGRPNLLLSLTVGAWP